MTTLRVILDPLVGPPSAAGRYTERLTRALIAHAPEGSGVAGVISAVPDEDAAAVEDSLRGLRELHRARLARRELRAAWQHGITVVPGRGLLHATDLVSPLSRHDRRRDPDSQLVVTIADAAAWIHPEALDPREVGRRRALGARAARYADAIVVPTHAVADAVGEHLGVTDRIRVIAAAPRPGAVASPIDPATLDLPPRYVAVVLPDGVGSRTEQLAAILSSLEDGLHLVVVAPSEAAEPSAEPRIVTVGAPGDAALAAILEGADALIEPDPQLGFALAALEAMSTGIPVVHVRGPEADELLADAGLAVDTADELGAAIGSLRADALLHQRHATLGRDRANAFSWRDSAEKVWQLHADL